MIQVFDFTAPTALLLGRYQPWHDGHTALFKAALAKTGQVIIGVRDVQGVGDNPFSYSSVRDRMIEALAKHGYTFGKEYVVQYLPNIVDISYGRDVGYTFTQHDLGQDTHAISATAIRADMRERGEL